MSQNQQNYQNKKWAAPNRVAAGKRAGWSLSTPAKKSFVGF
jgi:hypothetical protein